MKFIPYGMPAERNLLRCFCFIGENDSENYYEATVTFLFYINTSGRVRHF
jgi:hypothetical protein